MKTLVRFIQPKDVEPTGAPSPKTARQTAATRTGQRRPPAAARAGLAPKLRGVNRESHGLFGSASDPP